MIRLIVFCVLLAVLPVTTQADWAEFAASPGFQGLEPEFRHRARMQYYERIIAPSVPENKADAVLQSFLRDTQNDVDPPRGYQRINRDPETVAAEAAAKVRLAECVLEHIKGVQSDRAAQAILGACGVTTDME